MSHISISTPHVHAWSNDTLYCHCLRCGITLRRYIEWLEGLAASLAKINWLNETNPILANLIDEARAHSVGSDLAHVV